VGFIEYTVHSIENRSKHMDNTEVLANGECINEEATLPNLGQGGISTIYVREVPIHKSKLTLQILDKAR
jgi:hypothetical protein